MDDNYNYNGYPIFAAPGLHESAIKVICETIRPGATILDLGCGSGSMTQRLIDNGYNVFSADIDLSKFNLKTESMIVDLNSEFSDLFKSRKFAGIVALEVIEHLENPLHFLRHLKELMDKDTIAYISFPNIYMYLCVRSFLKDASFIEWNPEQYWETGHQTVLTDWLFEQHLSKIGLSIESKEFVALLDMTKIHKKNFKIQINKIFLNLLCFLNRTVTRNMRTSNCVLYGVYSRNK